MASAKGCYLVGSVPLADAETVFRDALSLMPGRLKRIPDGETGHRLWFVFTQMPIFQAYPPMVAEFRLNLPVEDKEFSQEQVDEGISVVEKSDPHTGYDKWAIESYEVFKRLRDEGVIPKGVKLQVSIPTIASVIGPLVNKAFQARMAAIWHRALERDVRALQDAIPHEDLSIQYDLAADTALWEGVYLEPWFEGDPKKYTLDYILEMIGWVDQDVELGLHNCYGDMDHKHWYEPPSLQAVADRGLALLDGPHKIQYFQCPIPVSAMDNLDAFIQPIVPFYEKLHAQGGELYLGVVQFDDPEGTKKRIEAALKYVPEFGVSTECGMGRTPPEQVPGLFKLSAEVSQPITVQGEH